MTICECLEKCPFFNDHMVDMPVTAEITKRRFCREDNSKCARYMVFKALGRTRVPPDLFPSQVEIAQEIISRG